MNILAQIFGILALIVLVLSYQKKSKKDFLILQVFMNVFFALQYFVLNAYSALATSITSIARSSLFYKFEKENKKIHVGFLILFEAIIIMLGVLTYNGIKSIIPIIIATSYTYGTWQKNLSTTYKIGAVSAILWTYYNFIVGAYASVIGSIIELLATIFGLIRLNKKEESSK